MDCNWNSAMKYNTIQYDNTVWPDHSREIELYHEAFLLFRPTAEQVWAKGFVKNNGLVNMQLTSWLVTAKKGQITN